MFELECMTADGRRPACFARELAVGAVNREFVDDIRPLDEIRFLDPTPMDETDTRLWAVPM